MNFIICFCLIQALVTVTQSANLRVIHWKQLDVPLDLKYFNDGTYRGQSDARVCLNLETAALKSAKEALNFCVIGTSIILNLAGGPLGGIVPGQMIKNMARARSSKTFELRCCQTSVENNDVTFSVAENKRFQRHYISRFEQDYKVAPLTDIFAFYDFTDEFDKDKVFENFIIHAAPHWGKYNIKYSVAFLEEVPPNIETTGTPNIPTPLCSQFAEYFIEKKITFADVESGQDLALASGRLPVIAIRLSFTKTDNNVRKPFNQKLLSASYALVPNSLRQIPTRPEWTITNGSDELIVPDQIFRASATLTMLCRRQTRCIEQGAVYLENVDFEALRFLKSAFLGELAAEDLLSFQLDQISQVLVTIDYLLMVPAFLVQNSNIFDKLVASIDEYDCQKLLNSLPMSVHLSQLKQKLREKVRAAIQNALENDDFIDRVQLIQ